jgi:type IX secretion system PorP/SprF family membrane protein
VQYGHWLCVSPEKKLTGYKHPIGFLIGFFSNIAVSYPKTVVDNMRKYLLLAMAALSFVAFDATAQDPQFTQFYANPLYLNPAFAGAARCPRLIMNYRNQWPAISGTFVTYNASYDQYIHGIHGGIGLQVMNDRAGEGTLNTISANLMYSYRLDVTRKFSINAALQAGFTQKRIDFSKLTFGDMIDPRYGFIYETQENVFGPTRSFPDFAAGFVAYSERIYVGFAAHHITQPREGFISTAKLPVKLTAHAGVNILFDRRRKDYGSFSPNILYQQQQKFQQLNYGFYVSRGPFVGGLWFRQNFYNADSFIALIGITTKTFKFGYSYDVTVSKLSNQTAGSHELSFQLQFECRPVKKKFRAISCPSF